MNNILNEIKKKFPFKQFEDNDSIHYLDYENKDACTGRFFIRELRDGTLRLSIGEYNGDVFDEIDLFEFDNSTKPIQFLSMVIF